MSAVTWAVGKNSAVGGNTVLVIRVQERIQYFMVQWSIVHNSTLALGTVQKSTVQYNSVQ